MASLDLSSRMCYQIQEGHLGTKPGERWP